VRGTHAHAHLHIGAGRNERLEHGAIRPGHLVRRLTSFRGTGQRGSISGRAGMRPVSGKHAELREEHDRSGREQDDEGIQRCELSAV
jgi:hypothetical protein